MITALAASHFLSRDWQGRLPAPELDECIAVAVDSTYDARDIPFRLSFYATALRR